MKDIDVIFSVKNRQGRSFSDDLTFEDTRPEYKNITLRSLGNYPRQKPHPECEAYHRDNAEFDMVERFEIVVSKRLMRGGVLETKAVVEEATTEGEKFYYAFSAATGIKFFGFELVGYDEDNVRRRVEDLYPGMSIIAELTSFQMRTNTNAPGLIEAKNRMKGGLNLSNAVLFFDAANVEDSVARFISLYTVMLHACSVDGKENQKYVDQAILSIDPHVAQSQKPNSRSYETLFTRLRNELSHKRPNTMILKVHSDIRVQVERFEQIVKDYLLGSIPSV